MPTKRLPQTGADQGQWGNILNSFLTQLSPSDKGGINYWNNSTKPTGLTTDDEGRTGINTETNTVERWSGTAWVVLLANATPTAAATWGTITGTLSSQTDLQTTLDTKVDKVTGKQLSTEDYTTTEKTKLAGITDGAEVNVNADWNATTGDAQILNKPSISGANTGDETTASIQTKLGVATTSSDGYLTSADWNTFNNKPNSSAVTSVAGKTGVVTLVKADVGLDNVDNTSDANKPVSTATQAALDSKQNTLISGTNIRTVNGNTLLGSTDLVIATGGAWGAITGTLSSQTDLQGALDLKLNVNNPTATGVLTVPSIVSDTINTKQLRTTIQSFTPTGTTLSIDLSQGGVMFIDLGSATGNITLTLTNPVVGSSYLFTVKQGATARNINFPTGTRQNNAGGNIYIGIANNRDKIAMDFDGTNYDISVNTNFA